MGLLDGERIVVTGGASGIGAAAARRMVDEGAQVAIFDRGARLVCMFFAFRQHLAGWMPGGTRFGPESITGGLPTPGAMEKFGRALRDAAKGSAS